MVLRRKLNAAVLTALPNFTLILGSELHGWLTCLHFFPRFSVSNDTNQVLYIAAATGKGGSIVTWDTKTWKRIGSKTVVCDTISAFSVSPDGKFLACGTTQGDVFILNSASKQVQTVVRKAHLGFVTALSFSHDSRALASVSLDSGARVTLIEDKKEASWRIELVGCVRHFTCHCCLFYEESRNPARGYSFEVL